MGGGEGRSEGMKIFLLLLLDGRLLGWSDSVHRRRTLGVLVGLTLSGLDSDGARYVG